MTEEFRRPSVIQEKLASLSELKREKIVLIDKNPNNDLLKTELNYLVKQEEQLLLELKESYERYQMDAFDFLIEGDVVQAHRISLQFIGSFSYTLQEVVTSISQSIISKPTDKGLIPKEIWDISQLDLVATTTGSFRMIVTSHEPQLGDSVPKQCLQRLNSLTDCKDDKEKIKQISKDIGTRPMKKYQKLMEIIFKNKVSLKMYDLIIPAGFYTRKITAELAKKIYYAIGETSEQSVERVTYFGKLTGVNTRSHNFEFVVEDTEEVIKGHFDKSLSSRIAKRLDTHATIQFNVSTTYDDLLNEEKKVWSIVALID